MNIPHIPERFLRHIWQHQRFNTGNLHTADARKVEILFPGIPNNDGGPDFKGARVRIGNITFYGDVELHQGAEEWESHLHQTDQHYNPVILHVVLTADPVTPPSRTASKRLLPLLVLHPYLDDTLRTVWMQAISDDRHERCKTIACSSLNDDVSLDIIKRWIERLAHERIEMKIRRFEERLKELIDEQNLIIREPYPRYYGNPDEIPPPTKAYTRRDFANKSLWEQLLYEAIMEGLGYSNNTDAFLELAKSMRLNTLRQHGLADTTSVMALLFGAAGLLPSERAVKEKEARKFVRTLRRCWKAFHPSFKGRILQPGDWQFFRLRPGNFPTARLASMCFLMHSLFADEGFRSIISVFKKEGLSTKQRTEHCHALFRFEPDEFWQHHYRFEQPPSRQGIAIGSERINDLVLNCILPVVLLYARLFKDQVVRTNALVVLESLPAPQENHITRILQQQLLKTRARFDSAFSQQGGIQLYKFFCTPVRCSECEIGKHLGITPHGSLQP
ncbi:MAG: hypothetical protein HW412_619 [Bacteroidetes bacterium]|nr:hypothetical protein [Bacteroidota bacterium]